MGFLDLFAGSSLDFAWRLMKIPCGRLASYVVLNDMIGKAHTVNWEGLERKRSCLVLRIVAVKNSAFVG